jgi:hypothetical protein
MNVNPMLPFRYRSEYEAVQQTLCGNKAQHLTPDLGIRSKNAWYLSYDLQVSRPRKSL